MDYSAPFPCGQAYAPFSQDLPAAYHGLLAPRTADGSSYETAGGGFDPELAAPSCASGELSNQWNPAPMQRFLKDPQSAPFFSTMALLQTPALPQPVPPLPSPPSQPRQGSPASSHEQSSCSGARSSRGDSDLNTDNMPSTPPDTMVFSPYQRAWPDLSFQSQQQFSGLGQGTYVTENSGVALADINPSQELIDWPDPESRGDFTLPQRAFTLGSQASTQADSEISSCQMSVDYNANHMASPEEMSMPIEDEVHIPDVSPSPTDVTSERSPPKPEDDDDEESEKELDVVDPNDNGDDEEYHPTSSRKRASTSSSRRGGKAKRRKAPTRSLERATVKRQRIASRSSRPAKIPPPRPSGSKDSFTCAQCNKGHAAFKDEAALQVHIKKEHSRPFVCVFNFAGCKSTFGSKNEWKRHVASQHLVLHYWLCTEDGCAHTRNSPSASQPSSRQASSRQGTAAAAAPTSSSSTSNSITVAAPALPNGAIFNRKDLYTQHLRRMHTPPHIKKAAKNAKKPGGTSIVAVSHAHPSVATPADWDERIKALQTGALRKRVSLPSHMRCPVAGCDADFSGEDAWDLRMEHVAKHLEAAAEGKEAAVAFGGAADPSLMGWVTRPEVDVVRRAAEGGRWVLNNPLRPDGGGGVGAGRRGSVAASTGTGPHGRGSLSSVMSEIVVDSSDEDAEGEYDL